MIESDTTARQLFEELRRAPARPRVGVGGRAALINVDPQRADTDVAAFATAYETDPRQMQHINDLAALCRSKRCPVVWSYVAYLKYADVMPVAEVIEALAELPPAA